MTHHDESDSGWDFLAEDLGISPEKAESVPEKKESPPDRPANRPTHRPAAKSTLDVDEDSGDFGEGLVETAADAARALFDPGPDALAEEEDEFESDETDSLEDSDEEAGEPSSGEREGQDGGKKRKRRRRRKKKSGPGAKDVAEVAQEEEAVVEEGEAPGEIDADEEEPEAHSAMEEEMEAEAVGPRHEWHVMTWADLVSKLYRPN